MNLFVEEKEIFTHFTVNDELPDNMVYDILEDEKETLWISTNNGITNFDPLNKTFKNYYFEDGLQSNEFNSGASFVSADGEMFFGGLQGFNSFYPDSIKSNTNVPEVVLTNLQIFHKPVLIGKTQDGSIVLTNSITETDNITVSHENNYLSFQFAALDYMNSNNNEYSYFVENLTNEWINLGRTHDIDLNLPPGEYTLKIRGSNNDGVWNMEGVSLGITVSPPFWGTLWFRAFGLAILIFAIISVHKYRTYTYKKRNKQLEEYNKILNNEIKEREKADKALKKSEEHYRDLVVKAGIAISIEDVTGKIIFSNNIHADIFGFTTEEMKKIYY